MEGWCTLVWGCHSIPSFACSLKLASKDDLKGDPVLRISTNDKSYCMPGPGLPLWCNPEHHENKQTKQQRTNCGLNNFLSQGHTNRGHGEGTQPSRTYPALPQADWLKPRIHVPCIWPERGLALQRRGHLQSELAAKGGCSRWKMTELSVGRPWRPRVQATVCYKAAQGKVPLHWETQILLSKSVFHHSVSFLLVSRINCEASCCLFLEARAQCLVRQTQIRPPESIYMWTMNLSSATSGTGLTMREWSFIARKSIHSTMKMMDGSCSHCVSVEANNEHLIGSLADSNVTQRGWSDKAQAPVKSTSQQNSLVGTRSGCVLGRTWFLTPRWLAMRYEWVHSIRPRTSPDNQINPLKKIK